MDCLLQIKSVELENCMIDNLTFLNGLTKLESLILRSINGLANDHIRVLQRRRSTLQSLYIYDTVTLTSIEGLVTGTRYVCQPQCGPHCFVLLCHILWLVAADSSGVR